MRNTHDLTLLTLKHRRFHMLFNFWYTGCFSQKWSFHRRDFLSKLRLVSCFPCTSKSRKNTDKMGVVVIGPWMLVKQKSEVKHQTCHFIRLLRAKLFEPGCDNSKVMSKISNFGLWSLTSHRELVRAMEGTFLTWHTRK